MTGAADVCPFTLGACDGGEVHAGGVAGCGYKASPDAECEWTAELPPGVSPRDFYNAAVLGEQPGEGE